MRLFRQKSLSAARRIRIVPYGNGWAVYCDGASAAESIHRTRDQAVTAGLEWARTRAIELFIQGQRIKAVGSGLKLQRFTAGMRYDALN
jgi:hypothetical protein